MWRAGAIVETNCRARWANWKQFYTNGAQSMLNQMGDGGPFVFKEWDEDGDGTVSKKEFLRALPALGLQAPQAETLVRARDALYARIVDVADEVPGAATLDELVFYAADAKAKKGHSASSSSHVARRSAMSSWNLAEAAASGDEPGVRRLLVHSYFSKAFNAVASERVRRHGLAPARAGELVIERTPKPGSLSLQPPARFVDFIGASDGGVGAALALRIRNKSAQKYGSSYFELPGAHRLDGQTPAEERQESIDRFNAEGSEAAKGP